VKDVEENTTVVGIPARAVSEKAMAHDVEHFDAYGGTPKAEEADPLIDLIEHLRNDVANLRMRVTELEAENSELAGSAKKWEAK
jgi:hypothetical protein